MGFAIWHDSVPVPSQDKVEGCSRMGIMLKMVRMVEAESLETHINWHPIG